MKEWRPQVLAGILLLTIMGCYAMYLNFETIAGAAVAGIVVAVTQLSKGEKAIGG